MHRRRIITGTVLAVGFACSTAFAQADAPRSERRGEFDASSRIVKSQTIVGYKVKNPQGEDLGKIEDLALDPESGKVVYAVLSFGGFLGVGDKLFAIPWSALQARHADETFILSASKEELKNAPGFDKNSWPNMADRKWGQGIHDFYRATPYWEAGAGNVRAEAKKLSLDLDEGKAFAFQVQFQGGPGAESRALQEPRASTERSGAERSSTERPTDRPRTAEFEKFSKDFSGDWTYRIRVHNAPAIAGDTTLLVTVDKGGAAARPADRPATSAPTSPPTQPGERRDSTATSPAVADAPAGKVFTVQVDSEGRVKSVKEGAPGGEASGTAPAGVSLDPMQAKCQKVLECILGTGLHREKLEVGKTYGVMAMAAASEANPPRSTTAEPGATTRPGESSTPPRDTARAGGAERAGTFHEGKVQFRYEGLVDRGGRELARFAVSCHGDAGVAPAAARGDEASRRAGESTAGQPVRRDMDVAGFALYRVEDGLLEEIRVSPTNAGQPAASAAEAPFASLTIRRQP
jgi:sporulation protein YlmC with PRC-barrel domain